MGKLNITISYPDQLDKLIKDSLKAVKVSPDIDRNDKATLLSREEVADLCRVKSLSTLWNWKKQGILVPSSKAGRKPLYKLEDVIIFLEGRKEDYNAQ